MHRDDVSTSTIGREDRKPLMKAYMFQRRILLLCSVLMVFSLIIWIVAISTDHWIIISGVGGIYITETRRFFMSSHSGLWRHCRNTITPNAQPNAKIVRNFTSIAFVSPSVINDAKLNISRMDVLNDFLDDQLTFPLEDFNNAAKQRMFAHWVRNDQEEFQMFKKMFKEYCKTSYAKNSGSIIMKPVAVNPINAADIEAKNIFGDALQKITMNSTVYYFVIPELAQKAMFDGWNDIRLVPKLLWPYVRDLDIHAYVTNDDGAILQLIPPKPPKRGRQAFGYDYVASRRCKYIEMFPASNTLGTDPGFDDELMDYIRTQASFACITVFVMCLGAVFSFYTFMNPRYMFKRLAGGIHLVSASCAVVVIQVLLSSVDYTREHLFFAYPEGAILKYGYGVYLAWFTFTTNVVCGLMFMWYSGKKKGNKAPTDELAMADEPTIMGR